MASFCGIYCIYRNKEMNGYPHLQSSHSWAGAGVLISCVGLGMAGSVFLHPDFGIDKTNKVIRLAHKFASRVTLMMAWFTAFYGLYQMVPGQTSTLCMYGLPLLALVPFVLI
jgi:Eukaryotic cytochrome b561